VRTIKTLGLAAVAALALTALVGVPSASATTTFCVVGSADPNGVCPAGQGPGGAVVGTSTNSSLAVSGGGTVSCSNSTISGTAPATEHSVADPSAPITLRYSGCTAFFFAASVTPSAACDPGGAAPLRLNAHFAAGGSWTTVTIPSGCTITISVPAISCTVTVSGAQTIGNGTAGAGGQAWTNGNASTPSTDVINSNALTAVSSGGGAGCPSAGSHGGTLTGTYTITTPATDPGATLQS
jgi:hypothetical protein